MPNVQMQRICVNDGCDKPRRTLNYQARYCIDCAKRKDREAKDRYLLNNPDRRRESCRRYYATHTDQHKETVMRCRAANPYPARAAASRYRQRKRNERDWNDESFVGDINPLEFSHG